MNKIFLFFWVFLIISCSGKSKFRLVSSEHTGISFKNSITETDSFNIITNEYIYNGAGVGVGDLNNDGMPDIVFAGNQVSSQVYLNSGNFHFRDITLNFNGLTNDQWYSGVVMVDINNDGWLDVYFTSTGGNTPAERKNKLWINQGTGTGKDPFFKEMAEDYGIAEDSYSIHAAFFDYDLDNDLDLYVLNNVFDKNLSAGYRKKINDGTAINNDRLYRNNGDGTFSDVTLQSGIVYEGFGLGLALSDVNKDSYPDIYVSNDYISNDLLYINQGDGTFRNEIRKYLSYQTKSSMGNDIADVNNDGNPDIYTMDMLPEYYCKLKQTINGFSYIYYINDEKYDFEHQYIRNMLHLHNGFIDNQMLPYSEVGQIMGIYKTEWSWSPLFADYDNDGDKDLIISNGYPTDQTDKDWTLYRMKTFGIFESARHIIEMAPSVKVPNFAFENINGSAFIRRTEEWLPDVPSYSNGAAFTDLDNDGDLDYVANNLNDKAFILRNYTVEGSRKKANFIKISLKGKNGNTMAIGAKVELWSNGKYQFTEHFLTRGYASSVDPVIHFGLSENVSIDSIKITWPSSGNISLIKNIEANQTIEVDENILPPSGKSVKTEKRGEQLFKECSNVINYKHEQTDFIDFSLNQKIIPHKFSQIGPCMAKGDIDNDGREDLVIGSTNLSPTIVFLRKGYAFKEAGIDSLTTQKEFSESDLCIVDFDKDGDNDVISVAGGYENNSENEYVHYLYENRKGIFRRARLPVPPFPASAVRSFDFDHDGDPDFFIGSRIRRGMFPYADSSWLIVNDKGRLASSPSFGFDLGMVTDALWTDYDGDGWEDLLVTREWNSLKILKNNQGKELIPQTMPELEGFHGLWYSVIAGDFDQDGDDDYIAGNLGENHRFTVSNKYPLQLYAIDLNLDGTIDPLTTAWWKDSKDVMKEYPVNYLDELSLQTALFKSIFESYTSFSYATVQDIFKEMKISQVDYKLFVNTTSSYIIWNDAGKFRWEKLPVPLQDAPVKRMIVSDFNNDKYPDVLVGGNDYTYDISTGYYDANKGIIMLSKGEKQSFEILPPSKSGILLQGMVESLLYFDGDTSIVVAGINRAKTVVFELISK